MQGQMTDTERRKKIAKFIGWTLLSTAVSVFFSLVATYALSLRASKKVNLKERPRELFPGYDWEFTGTFTHLKQIRYTIYCPAGFMLEYPNAESLLRTSLLEHYPDLAKLKVEVSFLPLSEFPGQPEREAE